MTQTINLDSLSELPITVTVTSKVDIRHKAEQIAEYGGVLPFMHVIVAVADGKNYAVSGLDVIEACKIAGIRDVPCTTIDVLDDIAALEMHIDSSSDVIVNPCTVVDAISLVEEGGRLMDNSVMGMRYRSILFRGISEKLKMDVAEFLREAANGPGRVYDLTEVIDQIVELQEPQQAKAFRTVKEFIKNRHGVPDFVTMQNIMADYEDVNGDAGMTVMHGIKYKKRKKNRPARKKKPAAFHTTDEYFSYTMVPGIIRITCACKKEWHVDFKKRDVLEVDESRSAITILRGGSRNQGVCHI